MDTALIFKPTQQSLQLPKQYKTNIVTIGYIFASL